MAIYYPVKIKDLIAQSRIGDFLKRDTQLLVLDHKTEPIANAGSHAILAIELINSRYFKEMHVVEQKPFGLSFQPPIEQIYMKNPIYPNMSRVLPLEEEDQLLFSSALVKSIEEARDYYERIKSVYV